MNTFYQYNAKVLRVVDGDTIDTLVALGFNISIKVRFRMLGYDSPETYRPKSAKEKAAGLLATNALKSMIDQKNVIIESNKFGKYRYLAKVYLNKGDDVSVNDKMIELGHVKPSL